MQTKHVSVSNRVATYSQRDGYIICGNSDYKIAFTFDSEWQSREIKYARFIWNGMYKDVQFSGGECSVPIIHGAESVEIGVCTGDPENLTEDDFWTTTPAIIPCEGSVLCITNQAQPERVQQMRDEAIQAAEDAEKSAETAAECAARAEKAIVDVDKVTAAVASATASAQSATDSAQSANSASERASASAQSANSAADRAEKATVDVDKATAAASSAATSAATVTAAVNNVDNAFSQVNDLLKLLIDGGA